MNAMELGSFGEVATRPIPVVPWRLGWSSLWLLLVVAVALAPLTMVASLYLVASDLHRGG